MIDSYLSSQERAKICKDLVEDLRKVFKDHKILLINKYNHSWNLDRIVDFYYFHGANLLLGAPPTELIETQRYEWPYTYVGTELWEIKNVLDF